MFASESKQNDLSGMNRRASQCRCLTGVLLLATLVSLAPVAVTAQQQQANVQLSGHVGYSRTSPPTSGVRLLEDIFQRVRSAPQIAMAQNLYKQQQLDVQQQQAGPTDYRLAIRPKKISGKNSSMPSPTLQLVPAEKSISDSSSLAAAFGTGGSSTLIASRNEPVPESWLGNRQFPMVARDQNKANAGMWESPAPEAKREAAKDAKERERDNDGARIASRGYTTSNSKEYRPPDLATAAGRLLGVTAAIQNAQQWAQDAENQQAPQLQAAKPRSRAEQTAFEGRLKADKSSAGAYAGADSFANGDEGYFDARSKTKVAALDNLSQRRADVGNKKAKSQTPFQSWATPSPSRVAPSSPLNASNTIVAGKLMRQMQEAGAGMGGSASSADDNVRPHIAMADIALLPPNVVTGIPLVRLGTSEMQASSALQAIGNMKQQKLNKWTIWSWNRPQNKAGTSIQLYMRNGLLDAMRIFDSSLIGADFGVTLGDSLAKVKERFGEPAFILQEPGPGAGQNYIYPISQIGFQLARPKPSEQPRVVSVLIFNVK